MNQDKYVFTQLVEFLNNDKFRRVVTNFVVRAKKNLQYRAVRWRRHINNPTLSGCKSRSVGYLSRLYPSRVGDTQQ